MNKAIDTGLENNKYDQFIATVKKMIEIENAGEGKGHFSDSTLLHAGIQEINFNDFSEDDVNALHFFRNLLLDCIHRIDESPNTITNNYVQNILSAAKIVVPPSQNPTQSIFRAYMNNKLMVLTGYLQLYINSKIRDSNASRNVAIEAVRAMGERYLNI